MHRPDYTNCTLRELYDVRCHIDRQRYPGRYQDLLQHIARLERKDTESPHGLCEFCGHKLKKHFGPRPLSLGERCALEISVCCGDVVVYAAMAVVGCISILAFPDWLLVGVPAVFGGLLVMFLERKQEHFACTRCETPWLS